MESIHNRLDQADWAIIREQMNNQGYALLNGILDARECDELKALYNQEERYRKTITMERYRFGKGEYKYFNYPLPELISDIRTHIYPELSVIANNWMQALQIDKQFPQDFATLRQQCHDSGQTKPTVLILKYGAGGFNTLHQDIYGDIFFPMQLVLFLNEAGVDYEGGEFVLTQQIPRAQSKATVLQPRKGDLLLFTTNFRPEKGSRGYYRINMKHGVSEVRSGERYSLGIIFHDALS